MRGNLQKQQRLCGSGIVGARSASVDAAAQFSARFEGRRFGFSLYEVQVATHCHDPAEKEQTLRKEMKREVIYGRPFTMQCWPQTLHVTYPDE
ncbi:hypothetical protein GOP47_0007469 [Adiantum capillus-veneris]|uniref:Uncharacterized protein n=1 Tax=Adiantum capillus-veneris TaxID=13818 RepID=A0A9D4V1C5_ADICA|nr:hypothetical protein GOP47_0007469 [Adiantum capillus-veneris]